MIDKKRGTELREIGLSYKEIANELGCSVQWCKTNLKSVPKNTKELALTEKCIKLGLRPEGVSTVELRMALIKEYNVVTEDGALTEEGLKLYKKIKTKVRERDGTVIRPTWLQPNNVDPIYQAVLRAVDSIDRTITEEIFEVLAVVNPSCGEDFKTAHKSLVWQIFNLSSIGRFFTKKETTDDLKNLEKTVSELRKRVAQVDHTEKQLQKFEVDNETEQRMY